MTKIGLALGGGAALGWAHIGAIRALEAADIHADVVAGTSIGSVVAACIATAKLDTLEEIARSIDVGGMLRYLDVDFRRGGLLGDKGIRRELTRHFGDIDIADLPKPYAAVAADLYSGEEVVLNSGPLTEAIRASITIPGVWSPVERDGRLLADGGMVSIVPAAACRLLGADRIIAVSLQSDYVGYARSVGLEPGKPLPFGASFRIARLSISLILQRLAQYKLALDGADVVIAPKLGHIDPSDFTGAEELIELGHQAAQDALPAIREILD